MYIHIYAYISNVYTCEGVCNIYIIHINMSDSITWSNSLVELFQQVYLQREYLYSILYLSM